jgi:NitT/TauT family transport system substrate-binding protein
MERKNFMRTKRIGLLGVAMAMLTAAANAQAPATKSNGLKLDIPYNAVAIAVAPLWIAIDGGLFQKHGIEVTTEFAAQSPALVASMLSGETPFAIVGEDAVIAADLSGGDIVIVAAGSDKLPFTIYAGSTLHSIPDLKGKKIGITQFGTTTDFIARYVLKKAGFKPSDDAVILPMGSQANMFTALVAGVIDAAVLGSDVTLKAKQLGTLNPLVSMLDDDMPFYTNALVAKKSWVAAHPNDALNVVRAYLAGVAIAYTDKKATMAAIGKYTKTTDAESLEGAYDLLMRMLPKDQMPKPAALKIDLDESTRPGAKEADPNSFIDPSLVMQLQRDGYIDSLYSNGKMP